MKIFGREINVKYFLWYYCFNGLIIADMFLITVALIFQIPEEVAALIQLFDFFVCIVLLIEYFINLLLSSPKKVFILNPMNILGLIASIPFDFIFIETVSQFTLLRYLRFLKLARIFLLSSRLRFIMDLFEKTGLHKIVIGIIATVGIFTLALYLFGPSYGLFDDFYFVIVTLTTVGYGDIIPQTYNERVLSIILILIGIVVFSTITASISSFLTDRLLDDNEEDIKEEIESVIEDKTDNIENELKSIHEENKQLKDEINGLKNEISKLKDIIIKERD